MMTAGSAMSRAAVIGSGNIATDLMIKIVQLSQVLQIDAMVGIDPASPGLARARSMGIRTTADGVAGLLAMPEFDDVDIVFDATSAAAHIENARILQPFGKRLIDLTPAALGPFVVPAVNLGEHADAENLNMVTCGGQATIPIVAAISAVTPVHYAEIVASIASRSAGPGTRANIDEFTATTVRAIKDVGGAARGKAIIVLNPAEPPLMMRDTVYCLIGDADHDIVRDSIIEAVQRVATYVPGYRLKQQIQFAAAAKSMSVLVPRGSGPSSTLVSVFLEVEGAGHFLPTYAGNLDIMTSAAVRVGEGISAHLTAAGAAR